MEKMLNSENTRKANLLIEMGFFYNGLVDCNDMDDNDLIETINNWNLYYYDAGLHAITEDYQFTYSFLTAMSVDNFSEINLNDFCKVLNTVLVTVRYILSSYQNGSDDQLSLNLA